MKKEKKVVSKLHPGMTFYNEHVFTYFLTHALIYFPTLTYLNLIKVRRKILQGLFIKNEAQKIIITYLL